MKKLLTILLLAASISAAAQAKKKDTIPALDTAFVFTVQEITYLQNILLESRVIVNGQQLTGKELTALMQWIQSKGRVFRKEQPK